MNQSPRLSIVIPTHNRRELLAQNLEALACQTWPADRFEVIVVADACKDGTQDMVEALVPALPYRLKLLSHEARSASVTRNRGAELAQGDILLFLDDDVIAEPQLVKAHMQVQGHNQVVLGYSRPVLPENHSWWQQNARLWWEDVFREMREPGHRFTYRDFFSGNVSMPATLFQIAGGFDPAIKGRLEDYELGFRLLKAGAVFKYEAKASGKHHDYTDLESWLRRQREEGSADIIMCRQHSELANTILNGWNEPRGKMVDSIRHMAFRGSETDDTLARIVLQLGRFCERFNLRGFYWRVTGVLREYYYWRGVSAGSGGRQALMRLLQEASLPPVLSADAPLMDMADLPAGDALRSLLADADRKGLRLAYGGTEIMTLSPQIGTEPLHLEHVKRLFKQFLNDNFLPGLFLEELRHQKESA